MTIDRFRDENFFLSSMAEIRGGIEHPSGYVVPTAEHYYQLTKFTDEQDREWIAKAKDGFKAKQRADGLVEQGHPVREDWEDVRDDVMRDALERKFAAGTRMASLLLKTGDEAIMEGNTRGDTYWGVQLPVNEGEKPTGQNRLGRLLMQRREALRAVIAA